MKSIARRQERNFAWFMLLLSLLPSIGNACRGAPVASSDEATYMGAARCFSCHFEETEKWKGSAHGNHAFVASPQTVKGDFENRNVYVHRGVTSRMWKENDQFFMETEGPDGALHTYPIHIALGWRQTQVYLTRFPNGRYQTLPTYYDLKANVWYDQTEGVVPSFGRKLTPQDQGFWTNRGRTWNSGCSGCHGSQVDKNYDPATNTYSTRWVDLTINCEACHGPGSRHVEAWTRAGTRGRVDPDEASLVDLASLSAERQVDVCARCHAAKTLIAKGFEPGDRFLDFYQPAVPNMEQQFFADGRNKGLNYNYMAHTQSSCYQKAGLLCTACHDPHGADYPVDLRMPQESLSAVCFPCHEERKRQLEQHTHHPVESTGSRCVECHMPYIDILGRRIQGRDHSISVPVPGNTQNFGIPNACNACHRDQDPEWAARAIKEWHDTDQADRINLTAAFFFGYRRDPAAPPVLIQLFNEPGRLFPSRRAAIPMILAAYQDPQLLAPILPALYDPGEDLLVRYQIASALVFTPGPETERELSELLSDPEATLRDLAAVELARRGVEPADIAARQVIEEAVQRYERLVEEVRADVPEEQAKLGDIYRVRGQEERAMERYRFALELNPDLPEVQIRLGTLHAGRGEVEQAAARFRTAADLLPRSPVPLFNLGSLYLGNGHPQSALIHLERALEIDPDHLEARHNLGVAQVESGRFTEALQNLQLVLERRPNHPMVHYYLGRAWEGAGDAERAVRSYRRALEILPDLPEAREALAGLQPTPEKR